MVLYGTDSEILPRGVQLTNGMPISSNVMPGHHRITLILVLATWGIHVRAQAPFDMDQGFTPQLDPLSVDVRSMLQLPSGRIIYGHSGSSGLDPYQSRIKAMLADGGPDPGFAEIPSYFEAMPWTDDLFYARGEYYGTWLTRRWTIDGTVDTGFEFDLDTATNYEVDAVGDMAVLADGSVLMSGWFQLNDTALGWVGEHDLLRVLPTGRLDTSWTPVKANGFMHELFPMPNGQCLIAGSQTIFDNYPVTPVFRIEADGSLDGSFDVEHDYLGKGPYDILPLPNGKYLAAGRFFHYINLLDIDTLELVRWNHDGSLDSTFNNWNDLRQLWGQGILSFGTSIHVLDDGRLLVTGTFDQVNGLPRSGVAMFSADGTLLPTPFDPGGAAAPDDRLFVNCYTAPNGSNFLFGQFDGFTDTQGSHAAWNLIKLSGLDAGSADPNDAEEKLIIRPVPVGDEAWIDLPHPAPTGSMTLEVLDAQGRVVDVTGITGQSGSLHWSAPAIAPGPYVMRIFTPKGAVAQAKFIKAP